MQLEHPPVANSDSRRSIAKEKFIILLVDDIKENFLTLEKLLDTDNRCFLKATSGPDALEMVRLHPEVSLILLDVHMPGMSGFEVAKTLNSNPQTCNIPFIFVTANRIEDKNILEGFQKGAVDYLIKPLNPNITRAKVAVFERLFFLKTEPSRRLTSWQTLLKILD
ncbi:two-component system response regulator [Paradesertivirga mongoliensis]|uniref:Two-component system response regulator n=1 Tax=Paradesertivirga mongoliensis TaxID=2100740 RepID=A0ABW4ZPV8_9SPHI|nr:response regulator [Pedobacter mongoliensis]